ncbi:MAG: cytochrome c [Deltaproteobacteria bacterium]|nr:cytochrome c [Deltaproteobacteria bacterium]
MKGMKNLKVFLIILAVLVFGLGVKSVFAAGNPAEGKKIYMGVNNCHVCHGVDGKPQIPGIPSFAKGESAGGKKLADRKDAELKKSIVEGNMKPSNPTAPPMQPFGGGPKLTDQQMEDVITYIRSLGPKKK